MQIKYEYIYNLCSHIESKRKFKMENQVVMNINIYVLKLFINYNYTTHLYTNGQCVV